MESKIGNRTNGQAEKSVSTILNELKTAGRIENCGDINGDVAVTGIQFDVNSVTLGVGDNSGTLTATANTGYLYTRDNTVAEDDKQWEITLPQYYMSQLAGYPGSGNSNIYYPHANDKSGGNWGWCYGYWLARGLCKKLKLCVLR